MSTAHKLLVVNLDPPVYEAFLFEIERWPRLLGVSSSLALVGCRLGLKRFEKQFGDHQELIVVSKSAPAEPYKEAAHCLSPDRAWQKAAELLGSQSFLRGARVGWEGFLWAQASFGKSKVWQQKAGLGSLCERLVGNESFFKQIQALFPQELSQLQNFLAAKSIFPHLLPQSDSEKKFQAFALSFWLQQQENRPGVDRLEKAGYEHFLLSFAPDLNFFNYSQSLFSLLNGVDLPSLAEIYLDESGSALALGAIFDYQPAYFFQREGLLKRFFSRLASVLTFRHNEESGFVLGKLTVDLGLNEVLEIKLLSDELVRLPQKEFDQGELEFDLRRSDYLSELKSYLAGGLSESASPYGRLGGGELGLIIDLRRRPLWQGEAEKMREKFGSWKQILD